MSERTYQVHEFENGTHILLFDEGGLYERKMSVPVSEYRPESVVYVIDRGFCTLFVGTPAYAIKWLQRNKGSPNPAMVSIGKDHQLLSIEEFKELHG
jgi:hypothetical protein